MRFPKSFLLMFFLLPFLSCETQYKDIRINLYQIVAQNYDKVEIEVRDQYGKILKYIDSPKSSQYEIKIDEMPEKIQIFVRGKKGDSYVLEGISPIISSKNIERANILFIPTNKSVILPMVRSNISPDTWVSVYEKENEVMIFTEDGKIFSIDYLSWDIKFLDNFTPRKKFCVFSIEGKIFIAGGEINGEKTDLVEIFDKGVSGFQNLRYRRSDSKAIEWKDGVILVGGDDQGYCEFITGGGISSFQCGLTSGLSILPISKEVGLLKLFVYHKQKGQYEIVYITREQNSRVEVSYRETIVGIKRIGGEITRQGEKILIMGGYNENGEIKECEIYDTNSETVSIAGTQEPKIDFSVINVQGNTFIIGGRRRDGKPISSVEIMRDCIFEDTGKTISFPPKPQNCAHSVFDSYIVLICQGAIPEILPIASILTH